MRNNLLINIAIGLLIFGCSPKNGNSSKYQPVAMKNRETSLIAADTFYLSIYQCIKTNGKVKIFLYPLNGSDMNENATFSIEKTGAFKFSGKDFDTTFFCDTVFIAPDIFCDFQVFKTTEYKITDHNLYVNTNGLEFKYFNQVWQAKNLNEKYEKLKINRIKILNNPLVMGSDADLMFEILEVSSNEDFDISFLVNSWIKLKKSNYKRADPLHLNFSDVYLEYIKEHTHDGSSYDYNGYMLIND